MKQMSVIEKLNTRAIFSRGSGSLVYFMDSLRNVEEYESAMAKGYKAFSDGVNLIDEKYICFFVFSNDDNFMW